MRYTLIGLMSFPIIFGLMPSIGRWSWLVAAVVVPAMWSVCWKVQYGTWTFWSDEQAKGAGHE